MCCAPQCLALFNITTSKSVPSMVCCVHFDLETRFASQLRALFQPQLPKVLEHEVFCTFWHRDVLRATTACNCSSLASLLFDPPEPQNIGKRPCFATFLPFRAPASSFFWVFLFSDLLSSSLLFSSLTLPTSAFSCVHIVGSLTSTLQLINSKTSLPTLPADSAIFAICFYILHWFPELVLRRWRRRTWHCSARARDSRATDA